MANLLPNPTFATNTDGWYAQGTLTRQVDTDGSTYGRVTVPASGPAQLQPNWMAGVEGKSYTATFELRGSGHATLQLWRGPVATAQAVASVPVDLTSQWQRVSVTGVLPANSGSQVNIFLTTDPPGPMEVRNGYLDVTQLAVDAPDFTVPRGGVVTQSVKVSSPVDLPAGLTALQMLWQWPNASAADVAAVRASIPGLPPPTLISFDAGSSALQVLWSNVPMASRSVTFPVTLSLPYGVPTGDRPGSWNAFAVDGSVAANGDGFTGHVTASLRVDVQTTVPPRVLIVADTLAGATSATVYRIVDGNRTPVRPAPLTAAQLTAGTAVITDVEAPFGVPVSYVLNVTRAGVTRDELFSGRPIVLQVSDPWITDPVTGNGFSTNVVRWPEWDIAGRTAVVPVAGAWYPIVESDAMIAQASTITLYTGTKAELLSLRSVLNTGRVVLLRPPCDGVESAYLALKSRKEIRRGDPGPGWPRLHELEVQEVALPSPGIASTGDTLGDLNRVVPTTLQAITTRWPGTLLDIATTNLAVL